MKYDVIVFPVIDWTFRLQRPQQIALELARRGHRVFYLTVEFSTEPTTRPFTFWGTPAPNVYVVQIRCPAPVPNVYKQIPTQSQVDAITDVIDELRRRCDIRTTVSIIDLPFWRTIAEALQGNLNVYDCMDYHPGFLNNEKAMLDEEDRLISDADLVLTTSASLSEFVKGMSPNTLVRNACDVDHFLPSKEVPVARLSSKPVVGYFGAIDHWFDIDLVIKAAETYTDWDFVLIGSMHGCDVSRARQISNIRFLGEVPYAILPSYLHGFDVCTIPFLISDLTLHTNPVKMYEYLAAGKPMVGTAMPEIMIGREGLVYVGHDHDEFISQLAVAMQDHARPDYVQERMAYAKEQTWAKRVDVFEDALHSYFPRVTVIVLTYNNLDLTKKCLQSIEQYSCYPNLEVIVVDNASQDGTQDWLRDFSRERPHMKLCLNAENLGFAAGNNVGLKEASGDYFVLLNNDTQVTRGWIGDLLRHLRRDPTIGMIGPVTNNIGNEAKIDLVYDDAVSMHIQARGHVRTRRDQSLESATVAFFCVMFSRTVYEKIGGLDEIFTVGMFEDDDYCRRVEAAGYRIVIAEDVFIHHELSASLDKLGAARRQDLFERNKVLYEKKWGPWTPHRYREASSA